MEKKNYILKCIFCFICLFIVFMFIDKVEAVENKITFVQECEYKRAYGKLKQNNKNIFIGYTQVYTNAGANFQLQARTKRSDSFERLGDITGYFGFNVDHHGESLRTYSIAQTGNAGACPKYMTIESEKALFYNDLANSTECSGTPTKRCPAYFTLVSTLVDVKVYPSEAEWSRTEKVDTSSKRCSALTTKITLNNNKLYGLGMYERNSVYTGFKNQWTTPSDIQHVWFNDIYGLATTGKTSVGVAFNPDNGKGKTYIRMDREWDGFLGLNELTDDYCTIKGAYTMGSVCLTSANLSTYLNTIRNDINKAYPNIDSVFAQYSRNPGTGAVAITYNASTDLEKVRGVVNGVKAELDKIKVDEVYVENIQQKLDKVANGEYKEGGKSICPSALTDVVTLDAEFKAKSDEFMKKLEIIEDTAANAYARLLQLETDAEKLKAAQEAMDSVIENVESKRKIVEIVKTSMLDGIRFNFSDLSFNDGSCGVLSRDMKKFLDLILWYIKIAGVVIAIILSFVDYIKAASGSDDKSMANANKRVLMRVIFVAILFLVPALLEFVLGALKISTTAGSLACLK